jgi:hypothetical protein
MKKFRRWLDGLGSSILFLATAIATLNQAVAKVDFFDYVSYARMDNAFHDVFYRGVYATVFAGIFALGVTLGVRWGIKKLMRAK